MSKEELQTITDASEALVTTKEVEACMLPIRGQQVLIDRDVAVSIQPLFCLFKQKF